MDRAGPQKTMPLSIEATLTAPEAGAREPRFVVGQDSDGRWVAIEAHGRAGGIFRSREDAIHYAAGETRRRPDAITLSAASIAFRP